VTVGPSKGALVIVGGGGREHERHFKHFLKLAGGTDARVVIVPTASSTSSTYDYDRRRRQLVEAEMVEADRIRTVHTHDRTEADTEAFVEAIREADGVWFSGGRQWRLVDSYGGTLAEEAFREVLDRGGVIGGSSAGATIQGSFLVRGDTSGPSVLIGDHQEGFGYLRGTAIDQHLLARGREYDLIEILEDKEGKMEEGIDREALLGIGIDEDTALVVRGDRCEVTGIESGAVLIYDPRKWEADTPPDERFVVLGPGSRYDLKRRKVIKHIAPAGWDKRGD
jgi:cyanophycinase